MLDPAIQSHWSSNSPFEPLKNINSSSNWKTAWSTPACLKEISLDNRSTPTMIGNSEKQYINEADVSTPSPLSALRKWAGKSSDLKLIEEEERFWRQNLAPKKVGLQGADRLKNPCKVFVGGVGQGTVENTIRSHFSQYGAIVDCVIVTHRKSGKSRGFGFITYDSEAAATRAVGAKHKIDDVLVECRQALPKDEARIAAPHDSLYMPTKIFVGGIPDIVEEEEFKKFFSRFGEVVDVSLAYDKSNHRPRGFGFIVFSSLEAAHAAVGRHSFFGKLVEAKHAVPREAVPRGNRGSRRSITGNGRNRQAANNQAMLAEDFSKAFMWQRGSVVSMPDFGTCGAQNYDGSLCQAVQGLNSQTGGGLQFPPMPSIQESQQRQNTNPSASEERQTFNNPYGYTCFNFNDQPTSWSLPPQAQNPNIDLGNATSGLDIARQQEITARGLKSGQPQSFSLQHMTFQGVAMASPGAFLRTTHGPIAQYLLTPGNSLSMSAESLDATCTNRNKHTDAQNGLGFASSVVLTPSLVQMPGSNATCSPSLQNLVSGLLSPQAERSNPKTSTGASLELPPVADNSAEGGAGIYQERSYIPQFASQKFISSPGCLEAITAASAAQSNPLNANSQMPRLPLWSPRLTAYSPSLGSYDASAVNPSPIFTLLHPSAGAPAQQAASLNFATPQMVPAPLGGQHATTASGVIGSPQMSYQPQGGLIIPCYTTTSFPDNSSQPTSLCLAQQHQRINLQSEDCTSPKVSHHISSSLLSTQSTQKPIMRNSFEMTPMNTISTTTTCGSNGALQKSFHLGENIEAWTSDSSASTFQRFPVGPSHGLQGLGSPVVQCSGGHPSEELGALAGTMLPSWAPHCNSESLDMVPGYSGAFFLQDASSHFNISPPASRTPVAFSPQLRPDTTTQRLQHWGSIHQQNDGLPVQEKEASGEMFENAIPSDVLLEQKQLSALRQHTLGINKAVADTKQEDASKL